MDALGHGIAAAWSQMALVPAPHWAALAAAAWTLALVCFWASARRPRAPRATEPRLLLIAEYRARRAARQTGLLPDRLPGRRPGRRAA